MKRRIEPVTLEPTPLDLREGETLASRATSAIISLISAGEVTAGQRLGETVLARRLGMGTMPVREALRVLAGDGVVELRPHAGAFLRSMTAKDVGDTLKGFMGILMVALDELEPTGIAHISSRLRVNLDVAAKAIKARRDLDFLNAIAMFKLHLIEASGNRFLIANLKKIHFDYYNLQALRYITHQDAADMAGAYPEILEFMERGRFDSAKALFNRNKDRILSVLKAHA